MIHRKEAGMTVIVKTITRLTLGFILLYGIYITFNGRMAPGGGFAGGVIVALSLIHIMLAFGKETALKRLRTAMLRTVISAGALAFLIAAMSNLGARFPAASEIVIPFFEMIIVGGGLFAIFIALVLMSKTDRDAE